ncbi:hypothetical protein TNCV_790241 [Trichonephila clavipes]|nr:hypothetical protein TNCV_790241 [Trichonephila clavipes]
MIEVACRSLDIFGHWNAKRSSVPYLMYWALDVGLACFRDGVSLLVDMEGDSGRGELLVSAVLEKSSRSLTDLFGAPRPVGP